MKAVILDKKYKDRYYWVKDPKKDHYVQFQEHKAIVNSSEAVELLKNDDFQFIPELSDYACVFDPSTWTDTYKKLYWEANADIYSGFGSVSMNAVKSLSKNGIDVCFGGERFDEQTFPDKEFDKLKKNTDPNCIMIQYRQPGQYRRRMTERMFGYTPWETTKVPASWVERMNEMEGIFTTCKQNKQAFIDSGVKVPIYIYYHGINSKDYSFMERPEDPVWVFGTLGRLSMRKGTDLVVQAFKEEFKTEKDVALILKSSDAIVPFEGISNMKSKARDERITIIGEVLSHEKKLELYKMMDCFVFPSRGEGFGLPPMEAMATGLPVIMTNWAGLSEYGNKEDTMLLDYKMVKAENFTKQIYKEDCGEWSEPDLDQLKKYMRWSYEHRSESRKMGKKASIRIHRDWTWDKVTGKFIRTLDKIIK